MSCDFPVARFSFLSYPIYKPSNPTYNKIRVSPKFISLLFFSLLPIFLRKSVYKFFSQPNTFLPEELVPFKMMKKSSLLAASVAAASATVVSVSSSTHVSIQGGGSQRGHADSSSSESLASTEKFAPRFDGLRFIETLVTAHR